MRVPVTTSLTIEQFVAGQVTVKVSGTKNAVYGKRADGTVFASQRPGVNIYEDASAASVTTGKGRGIYYWAAVGAKYFVNGATVYKASYSAPLAATMTAGTDKVNFYEVGDNLVIIDTENNEGWYITSAASTTLVSISDVDFPPNQTPALTLAHGGASLNGTLYVGCTNGEIWNSAVEDPTTWGIADFTSAEVSPDDGVALYQHTDHIGFFGTKSLEFFYDNANPTGSPLNARSDVVHEIGTINHDTVWAEFNTLYFVGQTPSGSLGVYVLTNFQVNKISNNDFDSLLTSAVITDNVEVFGSGFTAGGRSFYCLTLFNIGSGVVSTEATYVFDSSGVLGDWELAYTDIDDMPLIGWTLATETRAGEGILSNGDLVTINDDFNPQDTTEEQVYILADYFEPGYYTSTAADGDPIEMEIVLGQGDSGTLETKFADGLRVVATPTDASQLMTIQWSDEGNNNYNTGRTIDLSNPKNRLNRCGSYKIRNYKLTYSGTENVEVEGLEMKVRA
ncbi:MAG: hypothetical protein ABFS03_00935 [Chloroflexota bacterium]